MNAMTMAGPYATAERMEAKGVFVRAINTTTGEKAQQHMLLDKYMVAHTIMPGQTVELEMTEQDYARFQELGAKGHPVKLTPLPRAGSGPAQQSKQPQGSDGASSASGASGPQANAGDGQGNRNNNR